MEDQKQCQQCQQCHTPKDLSAFYRRKNKTDGRMKICIECSMDNLHESQRRERERQQERERQRLEEERRQAEESDRAQENDAGLEMTPLERILALFAHGRDLFRPFLSTVVDQLFLRNTTHAGC